MTAGSLALLVGAALAALVDWWAVSADRRQVEYGAKPLTVILLLAAAAVIDPADRLQQAWFLVALALSLVGDVALMLPRDRFIAGLSAFLVAHVAYMVGLVARSVEGTPLAAGVVVAVVAVGLVGRRVVMAAPRALRVPVAAYVSVISAMVALAIGTAEPWLVGGALLFYVSDALIGWTRFVADMRHGRLLVMVTYHLGQAGLVVGLV